MPATRVRRPRGGRSSMPWSEREMVAALGNWRPSGPTSCTPSTTNAAPGLISSSCWPAGSAMGAGWHGLAVIGSPSSNAPTVVSIEVCTNWPGDGDDRPLATRQHHRPHPVASRVGGGDRPTLRVERGDLGQPWRLELIETQCRAVDHVVPVQDGHLDRVGDLRPQRDRLRPGVACQRTHLRAVAEIDRHQTRMCGQRRRTRRHPQRTHFAGSGQLQRQVRRRAVLHHALRRRPRGSRVPVGGGVGGAEHVDKVGVAPRPSRCPAG